MVANPAGPTAAAFMELGAAVVQEVAKLKLVPRNAVRRARAFRLEFPIVFLLRYLTIVVNDKKLCRLT